MERAVAAGDPPVSGNHPADEEWLAAQQNWLASWDAPVLPDGPRRRRQWDQRKEQHARLVAAAVAASQMPAPKRARPAAVAPAPSGRHRVNAGPPKLRKPPPPTNADQEAREAYELQMGMYGIARDARRKLPRRTKAEDAKRKKRERKEQTQATRDKEKERSQQRRDRAAAAAAAAAESDAAALEEQVLLLQKIEEALPKSLSYRCSWESAGKWDEPLCRAIQQWAATHAPDGTQQWEDELMDVAIQNATTRVSRGGVPAHRHRRVGALCTLRWLLPGLTFAERPGALDPDPIATVEWRQQNGFCVCGIGRGDFPYLTEAPYCQVHERRLERHLPALPVQRISTAYVP